MPLARNGTELIYDAFIVARTWMMAVAAMERARGFLHNALSEQGTQ